MTHFYGAIAQLGERLPCTQEVCGSIPHSSTIKAPPCTLSSLSDLSALSAECLNLVLTTGLFFNKVNQAESLDCNLALCRLYDGGWRERFKDKKFWMRCNQAYPRVVQHCDLSVTTSGGSESGLIVNLDECLK